MSAESGRAAHGGQHAPALRRLGRYEIEAVLGRGAMGIVYRARDPIIDRVLAIKTVDPGLTGDALASFRERFFREARAAGKLNHPCIVTIYDAGEADGVAYMAMELLDGATLRDLLCGRPLPVERAIDVTMQVAYALAYAHEAGIVHRDVKPENVIVVGKRRVKLADFGIASLVRVPGGDDEIVGSPKYMSPEQARGAELDGRSDLFSLGAILYEMLSGVQPFAAESVDATLQRVHADTPAAPSMHNALVPAEIDTLVMRMLAKHPDDRVSSARRLYRELRKWLKARGAEVDERDERLDKLDSTVHRSATAQGEATVVLGSRARQPARARPPTWRRSGLVGALIGVVLASGVALWSLGEQRSGERNVVGSVVDAPRRTVALGPHAEAQRAAVEPLPAAAAAPTLPVASAREVDVAPTQTTRPAAVTAPPTPKPRAVRRGSAEVAVTPPPPLPPPSAAVETPSEPSSPSPPPVPRTATVRLAISPWGEVFIDGKFRGMTPPMEALELPPGRHRLEIRNNLMPTYVADVRLDAGDTRQIRHRFE
jgi:serine/threonine-protein kinase